MADGFPDCRCHQSQITEGKLQKTRWERYEILNPVKMTLRNSADCEMQVTHLIISYTCLSLSMFHSPLICRTRYYWQSLLLITLLSLSYCFTLTTLIVPCQFFSTLPYLFHLLPLAQIAKTSSKTFACLKTYAAFHFMLSVIQIRKWRLKQEKDLLSLCTSIICPVGWNSPHRQQDISNFSGEDNWK